MHAQASQTALSPDHTRHQPDTRTKGKARLYRMATPDHLCPFGLKSKAMLERWGYEVEDHLLTTRRETDAFMAEHGVDTTPQTWIGSERIGGYDDLRAFFGIPLRREDEKTYQPVIATFGMAAAMGLAISWLHHGALTGAALFYTIAAAMCLLALQKLRDVESFSTMFLGYDLLARRRVEYAYAYPFLEGAAGVLMLAGIATWAAAPIAIVIGGIGAVSVIKAVYIDKRDLKCACMGGGSNVPLGAVSLTENVMMFCVGLWMIIQPLIGIAG
ncbi:MauE/DoxX family redox-associated membrane protein [Vannielia sp.]|uniref:MauE/DoxX family redox-associated membrane protein n=1 Tax=Vannielia sp. TaxID=2813045 RepID=UPI003BAADDF1